MKNKKIVFIAPIPSKENIKDGMIQRVSAIDNLFNNCDRIYLDLSYSNNLNSYSVRDMKNRICYRYNIFLKYRRIFKMLVAADIIYVHSVMSAINIILFLPFFKKKCKVILDCHGVVPEEALFQKKKFLSFIFSVVEGIIFKIENSRYIYVTNAMKNYYDVKYKGSDLKGLVYPIYPSNLFSDNINVDKRNGLLSLFKIEENDVVFLYSGNLQEWQNIDLMLDTIKKMVSPRYKFILLTGQPDLLKKKTMQIGLSEEENVFIESVSPYELDNYYSLANFGFILRDDIVVNTVANPTKMIEYLKWGIIPIVKSSKVGDFKDLGYEYLYLRDLKINIAPRKSNLNKEIAKKIMELSNNVEFEKFVLNEY
ncbi:hypothetical protein [Flavobacterium frigidarium]|uniref:hypothetical protein n=1 Tax=Flavobacterium frigidarium TaxID=99286 RepID=UPI0030DBFB9D